MVCFSSHHDRHASCLDQADMHNGTSCAHTVGNTDRRGMHASDTCEYLGAVSLPLEGTSSAMQASTHIDPVSAQLRQFLLRRYRACGSKRPQQKQSRLPKKGLVLMLCLCRRQKKATPKSAPAPGCQPPRCFPSTLLLLCALVAIGPIVTPRTFDPTTFVPRTKEARLFATLVRRTSHSTATSRRSMIGTHVVLKGFLVLLALHMLVSMFAMMPE